MTFAPQNSFGFYIDESVYFPQTYDQFLPKFTEVYRTMSSAINIRDIAIYDTVERENGQDFFTAGNPRKFRSTYRKVIDFGALPNATTKSVAHNIAPTSIYQFTRIYGVAEEPTAVSPAPRSIPLPFSSPTLNRNIELYVTNTDVVVVTAINWSAFTRTLIILEYTKNIN